MTINISKSSSGGISVTQNNVGSVDVSCETNSLVVTKSNKELITVIDKGPKGDVGPAGPVGPTGDPGVVVQPTPPSDTTLIWVDNS